MEKFCQGTIVVQDKKRRGGKKGKKTKSTLKSKKSTAEENQQNIVIQVFALKARKYEEKN